MIIPKDCFGPIQQTLKLRPTRIKLFLSNLTISQNKVQEAKTTMLVIHSVTNYQAYKETVK